MKGSFVNAHEDLLEADIVMLDGYYPDYTSEGRKIRYFYSKNMMVLKLKRLLPQFLYHRLVTRNEYSEASIHDAIEGFMRKHEINVILAEFGNVGAAFCKHAKKLNIPLIVHFHGHDAHRKPMIADFQVAYREMFEHAYKIISVSNYMTDALVQMGADRSKIVYNPYGPNELFFKNAPDYQSTILSVGRFTDIKANHLVILAFKKVLESVPSAKLVMIGHGELLEACRVLVQTLGIDSSVKFLGGITHDELSEYFEKACCFVQHSVVPTYGDAEGTPVAVLEAGASALPVVSTRHAGISDVVAHGVTGFLVEEKDVEGMSKYLEVLLHDKQLCKNMGIQARQQIRSNFSIARHIACLQELIEGAVESSSKPR